MPKDTMHVVQQRDNRQATVEAMEIGDCISLSRRIDLSMGVGKDAIQDHMHQLRSVLDQQAKRARMKAREKGFTVEGGTFVSRSSAIMICAVLTRIS